jgi:hypothetical protein
MAGVDALLNLTVAQGADALVLSAGEVPALMKAGERVDLLGQSNPYFHTGAAAAAADTRMSMLNQSEV